MLTLCLHIYFYPKASFHSIRYTGTGASIPLLTVVPCLLCGPVDPQTFFFALIVFFCWNLAFPDVCLFLDIVVCSFAVQISFFLYQIPFHFSSLSIISFLLCIKNMIEYNIMPLYTLMAYSHVEYLIHFWTPCFKELLQK